MLEVAGGGKSGFCDYEISNGSKIHPNRCNEREARKSWFYQQGHPCTNLLLDGVWLGYLTEFIVRGRYTELSTGHSPSRINIASNCYTYFDQACHSHSMVGSWKIAYLGFSDAFSRTYFYAQICRCIWFMFCFFHVSSKVPIPPI